MTLTTKGNLDDFDKLIQITSWFKGFSKEQQINILDILKGHIRR